MTARRELPEELRGRPFAVRDALALAVTEHRIGARDLVRPFHGVRAPVGEQPSLEARCRALATRFRPGDAFAGVTAAALWGAPLPLRFAAPSSLHVSSLAPRRALRRRGVVGSQRSAGDPQLLSGLPLDSPQDAWLTLAGELAPHDLIAVGDYLITGVPGREPLCSRADLDAFVAARAGSAGVDRARRALRHVRRGAWSRPETFVRLALAAAGVPEPLLNVPLDTGEGRVLIPDLAFAEFRVAVEYNGGHHDAPAHKVKDLQRMDEYTELGWSVVNIERNELFLRPSGMVARTVRRLRERGWPGGATIDMTKTAGFAP